MMNEKTEVVVERFSDAEILNLSRQLSEELSYLQKMYDQSGFVTNSTNALAEVFLLVKKHHFALELSPMRPFEDGAVTRTYLIFRYPPCDFSSKLPRSRIDTLGRADTIQELVSKIQTYLDYKN
jgi:hypothetical protein